MEENLNQGIEKKTKFCTRCGAELDVMAVICPKCGVPCEDVKGKEKADFTKKRSRKSYLFAVAGFISGIIFLPIGYFVVGLSLALGGNSVNFLASSFIAGFFASFLAVLGILLEKNNKDIAAMQYIVCGIFVLMGGSVLFGLIPAVLLFLAGYFLLQENKNEPNILKEESL